LFKCHSSLLSLDDLRDASVNVLPNDIGKILFRLDVIGFRFPAPILLLFPIRVHYSASSANRTNTINDGARETVTIVHYHYISVGIALGGFRAPRRVASRRVARTRWRNSNDGGGGGGGGGGSGGVGGGRCGESRRTWSRLRARLF
jgi:uncharacterized membrane protein YgcG